MKKFLAIIASVVLAISMLAFTGCKDKETNPNVIEGNYKEATAEQVKTELGKIDLSKAFGDVTASDYKLGLEMSENLALTMDMQITQSNVTMDANYSMNTDTNYKLVFTDLNLETLAVKGSGYANVNGSMTVSAGNQSQSVNMSLKTNVYNDSQYAYVDLYEADGAKDFIGVSLTKAKIKASYEDIIDFIGGIINPDDPEYPDYPIEGTTPVLDNDLTPDDSTDNDTEITPVPGMDLNTLLTLLDTMKIKIAIDTDNGLKIKVSFTKESYDAILALAEIGGQEDTEIFEAIEAVKNALIVNALNVDLYVAFDANGLFNAFAVDCNIDVKVKTSAIPDMPLGFGEYFNLKVNGGMNVKVYNGEVTLPEGIATDSKYIDIFAE